MTEVPPQYFGQHLLNKGFETWFKYIFRAVEDRSFIHEPMHDNLFAFFQDLYNMQITRGIINIPPRSAKTVMSVYFMAYGWCHNPKANYIYTSYSGDLVKDVSRMLVNILTHPIFETMYPLDNLTEEDAEQDPVDNFWSQYTDTINKKTRKQAFSSKFVRNEAGGQALFTQMGSAITGFGASIRSAKGFSGGIFLDDPSKPQNIHSPTYTKKTQDFYAETLLSRLNNSEGFILNIQQRLHIANDLTAFLLEKYKNFKQLTRPLVENDVCLLPSQYSAERIEELKVNDYVWQAQYQQNPILAGGNIIKSEYFTYYYRNELPNQFDAIYQSWDTATSSSETADRSVCTTWGVLKTPYDELYYLIDVWTGRMEYPELRQKMISLYMQYNPLCVLIEKTSNGVAVIQELKQHIKRLKEVTVRQSKRTRLGADDDGTTNIDTVLTVFSQQRVLFDKEADYLIELEHELISFPDGKHDDIVDSVSQFLNYMITNKPISVRATLI